MGAGDGDGDGAGAGVSVGLGVGPLDGSAVGLTDGDPVGSAEHKSSVSQGMMSRHEQELASSFLSG
eukprot:jgi/Psemu1/301333/fgenesh1_kg.31_\